MAGAYRNRTVSFLLFFGVLAFGLFAVTWYVNATTANLPPYAGPTTSPNQRCDSSRSSGKDCYFWVQLSDYQQTIDYQAYRGAIKLIIDEVTDNDLFDTFLVVEMCITRGPSMGDEAILCRTFYQSYVNPTVPRGYVAIDASDEADLGAFDKEANWASFHIYVRELYTRSDISVWGRRVHIRSLDKTQKADGSWDICWQTENVPNGDYTVLKTGPGTVVSRGGDIDRCVNVPAPPWDATYSLEATGPGQRGPGQPPPATVIEQITIPADPIGNQHLECVNNACALVSGPGTDQCSPVGSSCGGGVTPPGGFTLNAPNCNGGSDPQVDLSWGSSSGANSYSVYRRIWSTGSWSQIGSGMTGTSFTDTDAVANADNYYYVTATNSSGNTNSNTVEGFMSPQNCGGAPQSHTECQSSSCVSVPGPGSDQCASNADCAPPVTHKICQNNACVSVSGAGADQCNTNTDCCTGPGCNPTHTECQNNSCVVVQGVGTNQCASNSECCTGPGCNPQHTECRGNSCVSVSGAGQNLCATNADCGGGQTHRECQNWSCVTVQGPGSNFCDVSGDCSPNPTHKECINNACTVVAGGGTDECTTNANCSAGNPTHKECVNNACTVVAGGGTDECTTNANCSAGNPTHKECTGNSCAVVQGGGVDFCSTNGDCSGGGPQTHTVCENWSCVVKPGPGPNACSSNAQCLPPPPTCTFGANPDRIVTPPNRSVRLSWSCSYAQSCSISPGVGSVSPTSGNRDVQPQQSTTYTISCQGVGGFFSTSESTNVRVFNYVGGKLQETRP